MILEVTNPETQLDEFVFSGGEKFFKEGRLPGSFKPEVFKANWVALIRGGFGKIWLLEECKGGLGVLVTKDINDGDTIITEAFWYVLPELRGGLLGLRLYCAMEEYAKQVKASRILMIHYHATMDYRLPKFYEKRGYRPIETHYVKELWPSQPQQP